MVPLQTAFDNVFRLRHHHPTRDEGQNIRLTDVIRSDHSISCNLGADGTGAYHLSIAHHMHRPVTTYTSKPTSDSHMMHVQIDISY